MSNRTLFEFNHDLAFRIKENPEGFAWAMTMYLNSGSEREAKGLERFGVRRFGMRHHLDGFSIDFGGQKIAEDSTP